MSRILGTVVRGLRAPIFREGDDLATIVCDVLSQAVEQEGITVHDKDILAVTESVVARAQGNYAKCDAIAADIKDKFPDGELGLILPILSRNRFSIVLRGIAQGVKKIYLQLSYPADEVGNHLLSIDDLDEAGVNPYSDVLTEARYRELFGYRKHRFTGVDYIDFYREQIEKAGAEVEIIFANDPREILKYTKHVLCADIHTRNRSKRLLKAGGAETVYALDDILTKSINGSGYNADYGLLGSNKADEDTLKLFPRDCQPFVEAVQAEMKRRLGKTIEVMVYGDGAFKDPLGKIWELADPVVSPGYTSGLEGQPNELKMKYLADNDFAELKGDALKDAIKNAIVNKESDLVGQMVTQGTTPRRLTDLLGSLCDLTSGSGDKGTPIIFIQGYFDNYANEE